MGIEELANHIFAYDIDRPSLAVAEALARKLWDLGYRQWPDEEPDSFTGGREDGKKPDVQIIEEVFREFGPLHVSDLVPIVRSRGVPLKGKKKPTLQIRDKLFGSKRFHLFGNNVWGLPNQQLRVVSLDKSIQRVL